MMKQTAKALVTLLVLVMTMAPVLVMVTLPLMMMAQARRLIQHEETKHSDKRKQNCKTVLVTGAPHTKVMIVFIEFLLIMIPLKYGYTTSIAFYKL